MAGYEENKWLSNREYLNECMDTSGNEHFVQSSYHLFRYIKQYPAPIQSSWENGNYIFNCGNNYTEIPYNRDIYPEDHAQILNYWGYRMVPSYMIQKEIMRNLTGEEIAAHISKGHKGDVSELYDMRVPEKIWERGYIESSHIKEDEIIMNIDGKRTLHLTRKPVSLFLKEARKLRGDDMGLMKYIDENTRILDRLPPHPQVELEFDATKLENFLYIYMPEFSRLRVPVKITDTGYKWGRFIVRTAEKGWDKIHKDILHHYRTKYSTISQYMKEEFGVETYRRDK